MKLCSKVDRERNDQNVKNKKEVMNICKKKKNWKFTWIRMVLVKAEQGIHSIADLGYVVTLKQ